MWFLMKRWFARFTYFLWSHFAMMIHLSSMIFRILKFRIFSDVQNLNYFLRKRKNWLRIVISSADEIDVSFWVIQSRVTKIILNLTRDWLDVISFAFPTVKCRSVVVSEVIRISEVNHVWTPSYVGNACRTVTCHELGLQTSSDRVYSRTQWIWNQYVDRFKYLMILSNFKFIVYSSFHYTSKSSKIRRVSNQVVKVKYITITTSS